MAEPGRAVAAVGFHPRSLADCPAGRERGVQEGVHKVVQGVKLLNIKGITKF